MTVYNRQREGQLNDILEILGTTKRLFVPFWESTGTLVTSIGSGDFTAAETGGSAEALEDDFSPILLPCGLYAYHFHPTGDHHLAGIDHADFSHGDGSADSAFSVGAWIRPNAIASNVIMAKYDSAGNKEEWRFWIDASGKLDLELHDASASATEIAAGATTLTLGELVFVVATYDGTQTAPDVHLYIDGDDDNSDGATAETGSYVAMENTDAPLTIGCGGVTATPTTEFHGRISMPFTTGKELTAAEVIALRDIMRPMLGIS